MTTFVEVSRVPERSRGPFQRLKGPFSVGKGPSEHLRARFQRLRGPFQRFKGPFERLKKDPLRASILLGPLQNSWGAKRYVCPPSFATGGGGQLPPHPFPPPMTPRLDSGASVQHHSPVNDVDLQFSSHGLALAEYDAREPSPAARARALKRRQSSAPVPLSTPRPPRRRGAAHSKRRTQSLRRAGWHRARLAEYRYALHSVSVGKRS